jgi:hypothetical protein
VVGVIDDQYVIYISEVPYDLVFDRCDMWICSRCSISVLCHAASNLYQAD